MIVCVGAGVAVGRGVRVGTPTWPEFTVEALGVADGIGVGDPTTVTFALIC